MMSCFQTFRALATCIAAGSLVLLGSIAHAEGAARPVVGAQPADVPNVPALRIDDSISAAEMQDLRLVAEQNGISLDEAITRYAWNDNFALVVDTMRRAHPESFTSAEIVDAFHAWISFKGPAPDVGVVLDAFERTAPAVEVELRADEGYSERELERSIENVHYAIYGSPGVLQAATSFDADTRTIVSTVVLADPQKVSLALDLEEAAQGALAAVSTGDSDIAAAVTITQGATLGGDDSAGYHYGGEVLSGCTSGFGTRASSATSGTRGVATAGHCGNSQSDDGYALTYQGGHQGTYGDFQWHTGGVAHADDFYAGSATVTETTLRDVSGIGAPTVGQTLCKNGATNHASCQEVRLLGDCRDSMCNLVQMGARLAGPGDSGGPIYWGNTAYGLHSGWRYDPFAPFDRDQFARADRIDDALGIYIATN
ncbi:hypothetical protein FH969_05650 [Miniimonas arenae]|uniref:S1 family peptidase n=1 Tax=Miniimonas arenae TaxID=676201 RepID=A0A5C5BEY5_9MICO|nr:S1 family peptidase [Miniimonas arenae]TNU75781.1 hypothetical protein FH969_05650 [Miniimonas arenae]